MNPNVEQLRKMGNKVRVMHFRYANRKHGGILFSNQEMKKNGFIPDPRGGKVSVEITMPDNTTKFGEAICSTKDNYNKRVGVSIAIGRALSNF